MKPLLTVAEVADWLRVSRSTVYEIVGRGDIAGFKIGAQNGGIRIAEEDVLDYLEKNRVSGRQNGEEHNQSRTLKHLRLT